MREARNSGRSGRAIAALLLLLNLVMGVGKARAAVFGIGDGDVAGLIAAIHAANDEGANPGQDTIELAANGTYTLVAVDNSVGGPNGLPVITSNIAINGNGAVIERGGSTALPLFRILHVAAGGSLIAQSLTIRGGHVDVVAGSGAGGAIVNQGVVVLIGCEVSGNTAAGVTGRGGGILSTGTFYLVESTIRNNYAEQLGGGITFAGSAHLLRSTISGNHAENIGGGAIHVFSFGMGSLTNCTLSGNGTTSGSGGGIRNEGGTLTLTHCTVAGNGVEGLDSIGGHISLSNVVVADHAIDLVCNAAFADAGYNVIEDGSCITESTSRSGDPSLGPLADNGGPTLTHALLAGSIAFDAGDCAGGSVTTDQRGVPRPSGYACDSGAFERVSMAAPVVNAGIYGPVDEGSAVSLTASFTDTDAGDLHTASVDWGDGTVQPGVVNEVTGEVSTDQPHHYGDNGVYTITIEVMDDGGGSGADSASITVANQAPTLVPANAFGECDAPTMISVSFFDPGFDHMVPGYKTFEDFIARLDWGDGSAEEPADVLEVPGAPGVHTTGTLTGSHVYTHTGDFAVTVTLFDDDSGVTVDVLNAHITAGSTTLGDFDGDGDVDAADFGIFTQCFGGAFNPPAATCPAGVDADLDGDGDVDLGDFAIFTQNFTGSL